MNSANAKWSRVLDPATISNGATPTTVEIDTLGFGYLELVAFLGATDIAMTALKLGEADVSGGGYTDITGAVFGTSTNSAGSTSSLPSATDDNKIFVINVDLKGRKRYLSLTITTGSGSTGTYIAAIARLSRASTSPTSAATLGVSQALQVPAYGS